MSFTFTNTAAAPSGPWASTDRLYSCNSAYHESSCASTAQFAKEDAFRDMLTPTSLEFKNNVDYSLEFPETYNRIVDPSMCLLEPAPASSEYELASTPAGLKGGSISGGNMIFPFAGAGAIPRGYQDVSSAGLFDTFAYERPSALTTQLEATTQSCMYSYGDFPSSGLSQTDSFYGEHFMSEDEHMGQESIIQEVCSSKDTNSLTFGTEYLLYIEKLRDAPINFASSTSGCDDVNDGYLSTNSRNFVMAVLDANNQQWLLDENGGNTQPLSFTTLLNSGGVACIVASVIGTSSVTMWPALTVYSGVQYQCRGQVHIIPNVAIDHGFTNSFNYGNEGEFLVVASWIHWQSAFFAVGHIDFTTQAISDQNSNLYCDALSKRYTTILGSEAAGCRYHYISRPLTEYVNTSGTNFLDDCLLNIPKCSLHHICVGSSNTISNNIQLSSSISKSENIKGPVLSSYGISASSVMANRQISEEFFVDVLGTASPYWHTYSDPNPTFFVCHDTSVNEFNRLVVRKRYTISPFNPPVPLQPAYVYRVESYPQLNVWKYRVLPALTGSARQPCFFSTDVNDVFDYFDNYASPKLPVTDPKPYVCRPCPPPHNLCNAYIRQLESVLVPNFQDFDHIPFFLRTLSKFYLEFFNPVALPSPPLQNELNSISATIYRLLQSNLDENPTFPGSTSDPLLAPACRQPYVLNEFTDGLFYPTELTSVYFTLKCPFNGVPGYDWFPELASACNQSYATCAQTSCVRSELDPEGLAFLYCKGCPAGTYTDQCRSLLDIDPFLMDPGKQWFYRLGTYPQELFVDESAQLAPVSSTAFRRYYTHIATNCSTGWYASEPNRCNQTCLTNLGTFAPLCSGHGVCQQSASGALPACACDPGYIGTGCEWSEEITFDCGGGLRYLCQVANEPDFTYQCYTINNLNQSAAVPLTITPNRDVYYVQHVCNTLPFRLVEPSAEAFCPFLRRQAQLASAGCVTVDLLAETAPAQLVAVRAPSNRLLPSLDPLCPFPFGWHARPENGFSLTTDPLADRLLCATPTEVYQAAVGTSRVIKCYRISPLINTVDEVVHLQCTAETYDWDDIFADCVVLLLETQLGALSQAEFTDLVIRQCVTL